MIRLISVWCSLAVSGVRPQPAAHRGEDAVGDRPVGDVLVAGEADPGPFHPYALVFRQRSVQRPVVAHGLHLLALAGDDLVQIHGQVRNGADLADGRLGHELALLVHDVDVNTLGVAFQVAAVVGAVAQRLGLGVARIGDT
jgi:hypothetical protein